MGSSTVLVQSPTLDRKQGRLDLVLQYCGNVADMSKKKYTSPSLKHEYRMVTVLVLGNEGKAEMAEGLFSGNPTVCAVVAVIAGGEHAAGMRKFAEELGCPQVRIAILADPSGRFPEEAGWTKLNYPRGQTDAEECWRNMLNEANVQVSSIFTHSHRRRSQPISSTQQNLATLKDGRPQSARHSRPHSGPSSHSRPRCSPRNRAASSLPASADFHQRLQNNRSRIRSPC